MISTLLRPYPLPMALRPAAWARRSWAGPLRALFAAIGIGALCALAAGDAGAQEQAQRGGSLTRDVIRELRQSYVHPWRLDPAEMLKSALARVSAEYPEVLHTIDDEGRNPWIRLRVGPREMTVERGELQSLDDLRPVLGRIASHLAAGSGGKPSDPAREREAVEVLLIDGMVAGLDEHSRLLTPQKYRDFQIGTSGKYGGVGLIVVEENGEYRVLAVLEGSPGEIAGVRAGDRIVAVGQRAIEGLPLDDVLHLMRGRPGEKARLTLRREGRKEPLRLVVTRRQIQLTSVDSHRFAEGRGGTIGYLRLRGFRQGTQEELRRHLKGLNMNGPRFLGLILDLRNNPGGILEQAIRVADFFLERGVIVKTVRAKSEPIVARARGYRSVPAVPLIVLIDGRSASAAEIVAAALKNNRRAVLIGSRSFGKGTVQTVYPMARGYALKLTMARFLTPGDRSIQWVGVTPHIALQPVRIGDGTIDLLPADAGREPGRARGGFGEDGFPPEPPLRRVLYVAAKAPPWDTTGLPLPSDPARRAEFFADDPALRLARRVLDRNGGRSYPSLMETALAESASEQARQDAHIVRLMAERGIAWQSAPPGREPRVTLERVEMSVRTEAGWRPAADAVQAGQTARIAVTVRNDGATPLGRVLAVVRGRGESFPTLQLPIGHLAPGELGMAGTEFIVPRRFGSRIERLDLVLRSEERILAHRQLFLTVHATEKSALTMDLRFEEVVGNNDGRMDEGEVIFIHMTLRNPSRTKTRALRALVGSDAEVGVEVLRVANTVEPIEPGGARQATFPIRLRRGLGKEGFRLFLRVMERDSGEVLLRRSLSLAPGALLTPLRVQAPTIALDPSPLSVTGDRIALRGVVTDDGEARDILLRVNGQKVFYRRLGQGAALDRLPFAVTPRLSPGYNEMVLEARDDDGLVTRYRFGVWRGSLDGFPIGNPAQAQGN